MGKFELAQGGTVLLDESRRYAQTALDPVAEAQSRLGQAFNGQPVSAKALCEALDDGRLQTLATWLAEEMHYPLPAETMARMKPTWMGNAR